MGHEFVQIVKLGEIAQTGVEWMTHDEDDLGIGEKQIDKPNKNKIERQFVDQDCTFWQIHSVARYLPIFGPHFFNKIVSVTLQYT